MGPHERKALEREKSELMRRVFLSQMEGRRLDEVIKLLGTAPPSDLVPYGLTSICDTRNPMGNFQPPDPVAD